MQGASITLKNVPPELLKSLNEQAQKNKRTVNLEAIKCLQNALKDDDDPDVTEFNKSFQERRVLLPAYKSALDAGAYSGGTDSAEILSDDRSSREHALL